MTEWTFSSFTGGQENMVTACINKEKEAARHKKDLFPGGLGDDKSDTQK